MKAVGFVKKYIERFKKSDFFTSVATLASGQFLAQMISVFTVPIVSRIYSKESIGEFAIIMSTTFIVSSFSTLGLSSAIMTPKDDHESKEVFITAFVTHALVATLFFIVLVGVSPFFVFFDTTIPYFLACLLMYIYMNISGASSAIQVYVNRRKEYKVLFWNALIGSLATLFITVPFGLMGFGVIGFFTAGIVSSFIVCTQMLIRVNPFIWRYKPRFFIGMYKKYKDFIFFQAPSNLISTFSIQLPNQIFARFFGNTSLANYDMCQRVLLYPIRLIATPVATVYHRTAAQAFNEGKDISDFTYSLIKKIMYLAFIPVILLMALGGTIFSFVLGANWTEAGDIASVLAIQCVLLFCSQCLSYCRVAIQRQKENFGMSVLRLAFIVISISLGILIFSDMMGVVICFVIGDSIYQVFDMAVNFHCMGKNLFRYLRFIIVYCCLSFLIGFGLKALILG